MKKYLIIALCIIALLFLITAVNAADYEYDLNSNQLGISNTVKIDDGGSFKIKLTNNDIDKLASKGYCDKVVKTKKNYKLKKTPTKKVKTVTFKSDMSLKKIKKQLKKFKKNKGSTDGLCCQAYLNTKAAKILNKNKIKSVKFSKFHKWVNSPGGYYNQRYYKVTVKYAVCKTKKVVKPLKARIYMNWRNTNDYDDMSGYVKYKDAKGLTYKYYFDGLTDKMWMKYYYSY